MPILSGLTAPGDLILGTAGLPLAKASPSPSHRPSCPVVQPDPEVQRWYLEQLQARAKAAHPDLTSHGRGSVVVSMLP